MAYHTRCPMSVKLPHVLFLIELTARKVIRQVINIATRGDTIEIGLFIEGSHGPLRSPSPGSQPGSSSPVLDSDGPLRCTFHIAHVFSSRESASPDGAKDTSAASPPPLRNHPAFKTLILRRLLHHIGASLDVDVHPKTSHPDGRCCELSVTLERGLHSVVNPLVTLPPEDAAYLGYPLEFRIAHEPTLEQLIHFTESLRGKKATLFANSKGSFAQHLTSYLTAWGMDVSHVSTE